MTVAVREDFNLELFVLGQGKRPPGDVRGGKVCLCIEQVCNLAVMPREILPTFTVEAILELGTISDRREADQDPLLHRYAMSLNDRVAARRLDDPSREPMLRALLDSAVLHAGTASDGMGELRQVALVETLVHELLPARFEKAGMTAAVERLRNIAPITKVEHIRPALAAVRASREEAREARAAARQALWDRVHKAVLDKLGKEKSAAADAADAAYAAYAAAAYAAADAADAAGDAAYAAAYAAAAYAAAAAADAAYADRETFYEKVYAAVREKLAPRVSEYDQEALTLLGVLICPAVPVPIVLAAE